MLKSQVLKHVLAVEVSRGGTVLDTLLLMDGAPQKEKTSQKQAEMLPDFSVKVFLKSDIKKDDTKKSDK